MSTKPADWGNGALPAGRSPDDNPILSETTWTGKLALARAHVARVIVHSSGDHEVLWPHERRRVFLHRRPGVVYAVDLGLHHTTIEEDLPSRDRAGSFHARISIQWRVLDPAAIVRHQVCDVRETLSPQLLRRARITARHFDIDQRLEAEDALNIRLGGMAIDVTEPARFPQVIRDAAAKDYLGAEYGLWTRGIVQLSLDEAAIEHVNKMAQLNRAIEVEKAEQALRVLQEDNQQKILADRIAVYREIVAAGDTQMFALRLAQHPSDIAAIAAILRDDELTSRRETIDFVARMVDSGVVERWEVSDQAREALEWLKEATARVIRDRDRQLSDRNQGGSRTRRGREDLGEAADGMIPDAIIPPGDAPPAELPPADSPGSA